MQANACGKDVCLVGVDCAAWSGCSAVATVLAMLVKADAISLTLSLQLDFLGLVFQIGPVGGISLLSCLLTSNASAHSLYCILLYLAPCLSLNSFASHGGFSDQLCHLY